MQRQLSDKVCLVTGASRGIGRSIVEMFASEGATVFSGVRDCTTVDSVSAQVIPCKLDLTDKDDIKRVIKLIKSETGKIDILVNNAGVVSNEPLGLVTREHLRQMFEVNVFGLLDLSQQISTRFMQKQKSGSIINIASLVGLKGASGQCAYSASKGAVIAMTYSMAKELAPYNIRVNAIAPGIIKSERVIKWMEGPYKDAEKRILMGRLGEPYEIAAACVYLASDASSYVTGQVLAIDGGNNI